MKHKNIFIAFLLITGLMTAVIFSCTKNSTTHPCAIEQKTTFPGINSMKKNADGSITITYTKLMSDKFYMHGKATFSNATFNAAKSITTITLADGSWAKLDTGGYIYCPPQCTYIASDN